jgi:hypothetical protein
LQLIMPNQLVYSRWQELSELFAEDGTDSTHRPFRVPRDIIWNLTDNAPGGLLTALRTMMAFEICEIDHSVWEAALCSWPGPGKPIEVVFSPDLMGIDDLLEQQHGLLPSSVSGNQRVLLHT